MRSWRDLWFEEISGGSLGTDLRNPGNPGMPKLGQPRPTVRTLVFGFHAGRSLIFILGSKLLS